MRGRKADQIKGIEQYDFDKLANTEGSPRERRRFLAFAHLREGKTFTETAVFIRVNLRSLMRWVSKFKTEGLEGLKDKTGRGAKPLMPSEHQAAFRQSVIVLDKAAWHTTKRLKRFKNISLLHLPPASPELNPTEQVWQALRDGYLAESLL